MTTIKTEITVDIELNGLPAAEIEQNLRQVMDRAIEEGLITGHTEAEVESYSVDITTGKHCQ
ncbi:hypothetical protein [Marinobacter subterrani]|uniref:hypothetical protein n=1 Tax=Marinobacter subterrani TaxID=1658765 RepID=UPI002354E392|nr:hypothetical protein [Marinobacter subterrani]